MAKTTRRNLLKIAGAGGIAALTGCINTSGQETNIENNNSVDPPKNVDVDRIAADPTNIPSPVDWDSPKHHEITIDTEEITAEIEPGVTFNYMTFGGQVPGPMIRIRQGDTVDFTLRNLTESRVLHNIDFHAVYGTGGGAEATNVMPGEEDSVHFKALYPGAYIYHCAVPNLDYHISSGMFGIILIEPKEGLPSVDREFYLGQHEIYTDSPAGQEGHHNFDFEGMKNEEPTYTLLNGEKYAFTPDRYGRLKANTGEKVRVFMVQGGPNLPSYFHPIGNVWSKAYPAGSLSTTPHTDIQTQHVSPGSCMVGEMELPVPETIKLVDHALSRVVHKGLLAEIEVEGPEKPEIFDPNPDEQQNSTQTQQNQQGGY